jgi:hypothetical protein
MSKNPAHNWVFSSTLEFKPYEVTDNNIHINNSCNYEKSSFDIVFQYLRDKYPTNQVLLNRKDRSLAKEWATHNLLYNMRIARDHTKDLDLNWPQKWYVKLGYCIVGTVALWIIP